MFSLCYYTRSPPLPSKGDVSKQGLQITQRAIGHRSQILQYSSNSIWEGLEETTSRKKTKSTFLVIYQPRKNVQKSTFWPSFFITDLFKYDKQVLCGKHLLSVMGSFKCCHPRVQSLASLGWPGANSGGVGHRTI